MSEGQEREQVMAVKVATIQLIPDKEAYCKNGVREHPFHEDIDINDT